MKKLIRKQSPGSSWFALFTLSAGLFMYFNVFAVSGETSCLKINVPPVLEAIEANDCRCMYSVQGPDVFEGYTKLCNPSSNPSCNRRTCDKITTPGVCYTE